MGPKNNCYLNWSRAPKDFPIPLTGLNMPIKPDRKPAQLRDAIASLRKLAEGQLALHAPQMKFILVKISPNTLSAHKLCMHLINYSWKTWIINAVGRLQTPQLQTDIKTLNLVRFSWFFFSNRSELSVEFRFGLHFANQKHKISEKWIFYNLSENPGGGA